MANQWANAAKTSDEPLSPESFRDFSKMIPQTNHPPRPTIIISPTQHKRLREHRENATHPTHTICEDCLEAIYG